jgi:O-antigen/teichoic acid export membrane protein
VLAAASLLATGLNYVFLLATGRILGAEDYGALAALLGVLTVVLLPSGALQLAVSREVSRHLALGENEEADAFGRATLRLGLLVTAPLMVIAVAITLPLREILEIQSTAAVAVALASLVTALAIPISFGVLLGYQRFTVVAALYVLPFAVRLALLAVAAAAGYRLGGAVVAIAASALVTAGAALWLVRAPMARAARSVRPPLTPFLRYLWPVFVGLLGIAVLTTADLLIVRARFAPAEAGEYAAASAFARVAFFLPTTILAVLFPRTAARQARGEETEDILGRSLIVTAAFGAALAVFYGMTGRGIVHTSFGGEFAEGGEHLVLFTTAMTLFALANVLVGFHLSRGETRFAWIVAGTVPVQVAALLLPTTIEGVIVANIVVGTALLAAHELVVGSVFPALRAGFARFAAPGRLRFRAAAKEGLIAMVAATTFVVVLFWPMVGALGSMVVGSGSDASGTIASFWWMQHEGGYHVFGNTHHTLTGAPFGWDQGNGLFLQSLIPYYPAYLATKVVGPIAAYNLVLLAGYVLSGACMYLLVRSLGCARLVTAWAGLVYMAFPWHLARTPHASLVHLEFLPLLILSLIAASRTPSWSRFALVGLATFACWLTSGYFGAMAVVTATAFTVAAAFTFPRRHGLVVVAGATGAAVAATVVVGFLSIVSGFGTGAGLDRVAADLRTFGVRPLELVLPSPGNIVLGDWPETIFDTRQHGSNLTETRNYLGLVTISLALAWLVVAWTRRRSLSARLRVATTGLTGVVVVAFLLGLPSPISVLGREVWMPSRLLWEIVPAVRVPSRWTALVMTALIPLAALGLQSAWRKLRSTAGERVAVAIVLTVMAVSVAELAIHPTRPRFETTPLPSVYAALDRVPAGIVAEYPLVVTNDRIIWQTQYRRPLLNNADFGSLADDARRALLNPAVPGTAEALAFLGVAAIVTHRDALAYREGIPDVPDGNWGEGYKLVARMADGASVWRVVATAAPALVTLTGGFGEPRPTTDGLVGYPLSSPSGVGTIGFTAKAPAVVRHSFEAASPGGKQTLRLADMSKEVPFELDGPTPIDVLVDVPRGRSYIEVKTDPAATSEEDAVLLAKPMAQRAFGSVELQAVPISPHPGF